MFFVFHQSVNFYVYIYQSYCFFFFINILIFVFLFIYVFRFSSIHQFCVSINQSFFQSTYLLYVSIYQSFYFFFGSIYLFFYLYIYPFTCLPISIHRCECIYLSIYLSRVQWAQLSSCSIYCHITFLNDGNVM